MLILRAREQDTYNPFIVYDGKKLLALFRDKNEIIKLTYIHKKVLKQIKKSEELNITEMNEDSEAIRQYICKIIRDNNLKKKLKKEKEILY